MGTNMDFFQFLGIVPLLILMPTFRARYGIMASPPIFSIEPGMPSDRTDFLLQIIANRFL